MFVVPESGWLVYKHVCDHTDVMSVHAFDAFEIYTCVRTSAGVLECLCPCSHRCCCIVVDRLKFNLNSLKFRTNERHSTQRRERVRFALRSSIELDHAASIAASVHVAVRKWESNWSACYSQTCSSASGVGLLRPEPQAVRVEPVEMNICPVYLWPLALLTEVFLTSCVTMLATRR